MQVFNFIITDESSENSVKIKHAEDTSGHELMNINDHIVGAQINKACSLGFCET